MLPQEYVYEFNDFRVEPTGEIIRKDGTSMRLAPKDFDLLLLLLGNAGRVVSKKELMEKLWVDSFVEESNITEHVKKLRNSFGKDIIETIPKRGYKFVSEVTKTQKQQAKNNFAVNSDIPLSQESAKQSKYKIRYILAGLICVSFILGVYYIFLNRENIVSFFTQKTIFEDDFSGNEIDTNLWSTKGKTVKVENGIAKLTVDETDNFGTIESKWIEFNQEKPIIIRSSVKVSYSKDLKDKVYFGGEFRFAIKPTYEFDEKDGRYWHGVKYFNYDYESKYPDGSMDSMKTEGFFINRNGGSPSWKRSYEEGSVGKRIEPIWDNWFEQKLVYEPNSGKLSFYINGEFKDEIVIEKVPVDQYENKLKLFIIPWGWWLHHSIEIDRIKITQ
jgi:DNA-binding winged helix-turn-helix (wHTH) protein